MLGLGGIFLMNFMGKHFVFVMVTADAPRRTTMNFEFEILDFIGPQKSRHFAGNGNTSIHLSRSQNSNFLKSQSFIFFLKKYTLMQQTILDSQKCHVFDVSEWNFSAKPSESWFKKKQIRQICLKMHILTPVPPNFGVKTLSVLVAERSKASDHFRSFGQKLRWGPGGKIFFFKKFSLIEANSVFSTIF